MRIKPLAVWTDDERDFLVRSFQGHEYRVEWPVPEEDRKKKSDRDVRLPLQVHRRRLEQHREPYDREALVELGRALTELLVEWQPEVRAEWWRENAPSALITDEACEGLAQERRISFDVVEEARRMVMAAAATIDLFDRAFATQAGDLAEVLQTPTPEEALAL